MSTRVSITADEFLELEDEGHFELVRGELIEMNRPNMEHGLICKNVIYLLENWVRRSGAGGFVFANDAGVITERNPDTVRGPDCFFVRTGRVPKGDSLKQWLDVAPDLAVEVLSPSDRWTTVLDKVSEFLSFGVPEVWVVVPDERSVHVFRGEQSPVILAADAKLTSETVLPGFECKVAELFTGL